MSDVLLQISVRVKKSLVGSQVEIWNLMVKKSLVLFISI